MTSAKAREIIESHLATIEKYNSPGSCYTEIAFFGGSFTAIDPKLQTELVSLAHSYVASGRANGIRCSTRPDCIDEAVIANCKKYGMTCIELGVQSAFEDVLRLSGRGHSFDDVIKASGLIKSAGIGLGLQMMTGLPGDTYSKSLDTAKKIAELKPDCVRIYPTLIMEGTHLMDMYKEGSYVPQTLEYAVELVSKIAEVFESKNIKILRIGLQTTDGVNASTVKGPYHPAFAELVYGKLARRELEERIISGRLKNTVLSICVPKNKISQTVGHKKENLKYFKEKYNVEIKINTI